MRPLRQDAAPVIREEEWDELSGTPLILDNLEEGIDIENVDDGKELDVLKKELEQHVRSSECRVYAYHPDDWDEHIIWDLDEKLEEEKRLQQKEKSAHRRREKRRNLRKERERRRSLHPSDEEEEEEEEEDDEAALHLDAAEEFNTKGDQERIEVVDQDVETATGTQANQAPAGKDILENDVDVDAPRQPRRAALKASATAAAIAASEEQDRAKTQARKEKEMENAQQEQTVDIPPDEDDEEDEVLKAEREAREKARKKREEKSAKGGKSKTGGADERGQRSSHQRKLGDNEDVDSDFDPDEEEAAQAAIDLNGDAQKMAGALENDGQAVAAGIGAGTHAERDNWDDFDTLLDGIDDQHKNAEQNPGIAQSYGHSGLGMHGYDDIGSGVD